MLIILNTAIGYSYIYYTDTKEKHRIISEFGIKYFIDDYNAVIHHIDLNYMDCKAYRLNRGYKDETLTEAVNKINNLMEFFECIIIKETKLAR